MLLRIKMGLGGIISVLGAVALLSVLTFQEVAGPVGALFGITVTPEVLNFGRLIAMLMFVLFVLSDDNLVAKVTGRNTLGWLIVLVIGAWYLYVNVAPVVDYLNKMPGTNWWLFVINVLVGLVLVASGIVLFVRHVLPMIRRRSVSHIGETITEEK